MISRWAIALWTAAATTVASNGIAQSTTNVAANGPKSRVVLVRNAAAVTAFTVDADKVRAMVSAGIQKLTGHPDDAAAWSEFVSSNDVVGIKINTQSAPIQVTRPALVDAVIDGLRTAGVSPTNIVVWDRDAMKMHEAGYSVGVQTSGVLVASILPDTGWDASTFYESKLVGRLIWGDLLFARGNTELSTQSHLPKLLTKTITKLINIPVLQDDDGSGLAGCLYSVSVDIVDNNRRFEMFGQKADPAILSICAMPAVRSKLVLNIMDGLIGGFAGGPVFKPRYSWLYGGLYFSRDPVAVDAVSLALLEAKRKDAKISNIGSLASHVAAAGQVGLGQSAREQIEVIEAAP